MMLAGIPFGDAVLGVMYVFVALVMLVLVVASWFSARKMPGDALTPPRSIGYVVVCMFGLACWACMVVSIQTFGGR